LIISMNLLGIPLLILGIWLVILLRMVMVNESKKEKIHPDHLPEIAKGLFTGISVGGFALLGTLVANFIWWWQLQIESTIFLFGFTMIFLLIVYVAVIYEVADKHLAKSHAFKS
jgi:hypothetical protein